MCRLLALRSQAPLDPAPFLRAFARRCRASKEFQGDGWGVAWWDEGRWRSKRVVTPIWDEASFIYPSARLFLIHARSAFRNEGVVVENNMPFVDGPLAFAFNGELRGVRLQAPGDTGAWRLFHLFRRFVEAADGDGEAALRRLDEVVTSRTEYVRALNVVTSDGDRVWVNTRFSEDPDYFTLWHALYARAAGDVEMVASEPLAVAASSSMSWRKVPAGSTWELSALADAARGRTS